MRLTSKDFRLLYELDHNSRRPFSNMGKRTRISQQMVSYKVKNYRDEGLISGFYPLIDYSKLGYLNFRVYFSLNYIDRKHFLELISRLEKEDGIVEISECEGRYDVILVFAAPNPSSFNKTMKSLIFSYSQLKDYDILTTVVSHVFPRKYLKNIKDSTSDIIIGGDRRPLEIDELDQQILGELQEDAAKSSVDIADAAKTNPKTVISRIKKLQDVKIIRGFQPLLNMQKIGHNVNKILVRYHNLSQEREEEFKNFCMTHQNAIEFTKLFGKWEAELTVESKSMKEFRDVYINIRENFQDIIRNIENFPILNTYKKNFLPKGFFEEA